MTNIISCDMLEHITQELTTIAEDLWNKYSKSVNITKKSKIWQNKECNRDLATCQISRRRIDWINYKKSLRIAKRVVFDNRIQEIALTNKKPQNLMNQIKKQKLPAMEAIKFNGLLYNNLNNLQQALYQFYNSA